MKIPERSCRAHSGSLGNSVALVGRVGGARACAGRATVSCVTTLKRGGQQRGQCAHQVFDGKTEALPSVNRPTAAPWFGRSNRRKRGLGVLCRLGEMEQRQERASVVGVCAPGRPRAVIGQPRAGMVPSVSGGEARPLGSRKAEAWARQNLRARGASAVGVLCLRAWPWS